MKRGCGGGTIVIVAWTLALACAVVLVGCANDADSPGDHPGGAAGRGGQPGGTGGRTSTGGSTATDGGGVDSHPGSGGSSATGGSSASGGGFAGGSSGTGGGRGGSAGTPPCTVTLEAVAPYVLSDVASGKGARLELHAVAMNAPAGGQWTWQVIRDVTGTAATVVPAEALNDDGSTVAFSVEETGTYAITANYVQRAGCATLIQVEAGAPKPPQLRALVVPPLASGLPAQEVDFSLAEATANTLAWDLGAKNPVPITPVNGTGDVVPAYVRMSTEALANWELEGSTSSGVWAVPLLPKIAYDLLIIPPATYAPMRLSRTTEKLNGNVALSTGRTLRIDARDENARPLANVRSLWNVGPLPSTLGTSDATGRLEVRLSAQDGTWSALFSPPPETGRFSVRVDGVDLTAVSGATVEWAAHATTAVSVNVTRSRGGAALAGARVRLATVSDLANVATVTLAQDGSAGWWLAAAGRFTQDVTTSANGVASFPAVPTGTFDLTVFPDPSTSGDLAHLVSQLTVAATKTLTTSAVVPPRKTYLGKLGPAGRCGSGASTSAGPCLGMRVLAYADLEDVPPTAVVASDGGFQLALDPTLTYRLVVQPGAGQLAPQTVLGKRSVSDTMPSTFLLPDVVPLKAQLRSAGRPVPGAWVRVFCVAGSRRCEDSTLPLAEGQSDENGLISLALPAAL